MSNACTLCRYFMLVEDCEPGTIYSPAIGNLCPECAAHAQSACDQLMLSNHSLPPGLGYAGYPLPDHEKRNCSHVTNCTALHQRKRRSSQSEGGPQE